MDKAKVQSDKNNKPKTWLKKLGLGAFIFFFLKGIAWLIVGALGYKALF